MLGLTAKISIKKENTNRTMSSERLSRHSAFGSQVTQEVSSSAAAPESQHLWRMTGGPAGRVRWRARQGPPSHSEPQGRSLETRLSGGPPHAAQLSHQRPPEKATRRLTRPVMCPFQDAELATDIYFLFASSS